MTIFKKIFFSIICLFVLLSVYTYFSPKPAAMLVQLLFKNSVAVKPTNYEELKKQMIQYDNIDYNSQFKDGQLDIVVPKVTSNPLPTIIWVHGGAYVGGDKKDVTEYAVQLAAKGYAVVNMNYELATSSPYPTPLKQIDEVYAFILKHAETYHLDVEKLFIAGDSAGAQIASQYINIQVDAQYAKEVALHQTIPPSSLKGALLFCGPYDLSSFDDLASNKVLGFFLNRVAWAYIGEKDWQTAKTTQLASLTDHLSKNYIPSFITDGNTGSFEAHSRKLAAKLTDFAIPNTTVFYSTSEAKLGHEYQFMMDLPQAQQTFNALTQFLHDSVNE